MSEFIQIGVTALRDPKTGDFLRAVPVFVLKEDREACETIEIDGDALRRKLAEKYAAYRKAERKARKGS